MMCARIHHVEYMYINQRTMVEYTIFVSLCPWNVRGECGAAPLSLLSLSLLSLSLLSLTSMCRPCITAYACFCSLISTAIIMSASCSAIYIPLEVRSRQRHVLSFRKQHTFPLSPVLPISVISNGVQIRQE